MEVEIREAPRPFPAFVRFSSGSGGAAAAAVGNGTMDASAAGAVNGGGANVKSFSDSASLSPDALFRAYVERERQGVGRNISREV